MVKGIFYAGVNIQKYMFYKTGRNTAFPGGLLQKFPERGRRIHFQGMRYQKVP